MLFKALFPLFEQRLRTYKSGLNLRQHTEVYFMLLQRRRKHFFSKNEKKEGAHASPSPPTVLGIWVQAQFLGSHLGKHLVNAGAAEWDFPSFFWNSVIYITFFFTFWTHRANLSISALPSKKYFLLAAPTRIVWAPHFFNVSGSPVPPSHDLCAGTWMFAWHVGSAPPVSCSASFLAVISVVSPWKLFMFIIFKNIFWIRESNQCLI